MHLVAEQMFSQRHCFSLAYLAICLFGNVSCRGSTNCVVLVNIRSPFGNIAVMNSEQYTRWSKDKLILIIIFTTQFICLGVVNYQQCNYMRIYLSLLPYVFQISIQCGENVYESCFHTMKHVFFMLAVWFIRMLYDIGILRVFIIHITWKSMDFQRLVHYAQHIGFLQMQNWLE